MTTQIHTILKLDFETVSLNTETLVIDVAE